MSEETYFHEAARLYAQLHNQHPTPIPSLVTFREPARMEQNAHLITRIPSGMFDNCRDVTVGDGVFIEEGVRFACDKVTIGDFVYIGRGTTIRAPEFSVGDYTRINEVSYCGGRKPLRIGRNVYLGRGVYLDSNGGLTLEDNVGVGAVSQLWTHMEHGDRIFGLRDRWHTERELIVRKDAWLAARVVVSNTREIGERALILNESNLLCDIPADTTWCGNPAKDMTEKLGRQFKQHPDRIVDFFQKQERLDDEIDRFNDLHPELPDTLFSGMLSPDEMAARPEITYFSVRDRTYTKRRTAAEVAFLRFTSGKFTPVGEE